LGIHLTGTANMTQTEAYADDDVFNFAGLILEADYWNSKERKIERKPISFEDVTWEIKPWYNSKTKDQIDAGEAYSGYVLITVGQDITDLGPGYQVGNVLYNTSGITALAPLDKVYTVKKDGIKLVGEKEGLSDYFFWEENTKNAWLSKIGSDAELEITYTDGKAAVRKNVVDLSKKSRIWYNSNPDSGVLLDNPWYTIATNTSRSDDFDFDIIPLQYPFTKKNTNTKITLYYRGAMLDIPVDVYTTLVKIEAEPAVTFYPDPYRDNDVDNGTGGPAELARKLNVMATYQAINNPEKYLEKKLSYWYGVGFDDRKDALDTVHKTTENPKGDYPNYGAFYLFGTEYDDVIPNTNGTPAENVDNASTYGKGFKKYTDNLKKGKETTTNVTIKHTIAVQDIAWYYDRKFKTSSLGLSNGILPDGYHPYSPLGAISDEDESKNFGPKVSQSKKWKVAVTWVPGYDK